MPVSRVEKPKTKRGKRYLENRDPKVIENVKKAMFIKAGKTNEVVRKALTELEYLAKKNDHSLFTFGFSSKKRPNSLVIGRTFNFEVLDMFELAIVNYKPMEDFKEAKVTFGTKPCLIFNGEAFSTDPDFIRLKCLLGDFFRGEVVDNIRLQGLEHVLNFTAVNGKLLMRGYKTKFLKSGTKVPNVELVEIGPSFDFLVKRSKQASDELYKKSKQQPKEIQPKKKKNVSVNVFGTKLGRIHMQKQDLGKLQLRKLKALKRKNDKTEKESDTNSSSKKSKQDNFE